MADTIIISKVAGGTILVNNGAREYNLLPSYRLQKVDGKVQVLTDLGGRIDTFDPVEVEKVILADKTEILIPDLNTLFVQLFTNFFNLSSLGGDFFADVSKGLISGHKAIVITGSILMPVKDVMNDVWGQGGTLEYLAVAETHNIKSTDLNDTLLGTGARTIGVTGLGAGNIELTEDIDMDGTNDVLTNNAYIYPPVLEVLTAGSVERVNIGDITATSSGTTKVQSKIEIGVSISKNSHYTVPSGKSLLIVKVVINAARTAAGMLPNITLKGLTRFAGQDPDAAWVSRTERQMDTAVLDQLIVDQPVNDLLPEGTELRATATSSQDNTRVRSKTYAILIDN